MSRHGFSSRNGQNTPEGEVRATGKFGRLFPELKALRAPIEALKDLAEAMIEPEGVPLTLTSGIPSGYTYFGQFVDHDITFDPTSLEEQRVDPLALRNYRTPSLDLDSVYGSGPVAQPQLYVRDRPGLLQIGVTRRGIDDSSIDTSANDLPRGPNGFAIIGDPRNDENLIIAQLHLAFLRFHNRVIAGLGSGSIEWESPIRKDVFEQARDLVLWHYQWIVLNDYLPRVLDASELDQVRRKGSMLRPMRPDGTEPFMPVEFSAAAYRFGHSMVRPSYDYNRLFNEATGRPAELSRLFEFSGRPGGGNVPVPSDWAIDWRRFFDFGADVPVNFSRRLGASLSSGLSKLPGVTGSANLAFRNLERGNSLGLPPGQSVARFLGYEALTPEEIAKAGRDGAAAARHQLHIETPLWFYILKEAELRGGGRRLGPLGSRIVAEVLIGLLERDSSSYLLRNPRWQPTLPRSEKTTFTMTDLLAFAGDVNPLN